MIVLGLVANLVIIRYCNMCVPLRSHEYRMGKRSKAKKSAKAPRVNKVCTIANTILNTYMASVILTQFSTHAKNRELKSLSKKKDLML